VPVGRIGHACAGAGAAGEQALRHQHAQRLAVGIARHLPALAGLDLAVEHVPRPQLARDDRDADVTRQRAIDAQQVALGRRTGDALPACTSSARTDRTIDFPYPVSGQ
jgi:hypothetical protein